MPAIIREIDEELPPVNVIEGNLGKACENLYEGRRYIRNIMFSCIFGYSAVLRGRYDYASVIYGSPTSGLSVFI